jgi:hypothetical protein
MNSYHEWYWGQGFDTQPEKTASGTHKPTQACRHSTPNGQYSSTTPTNEVPHMPQRRHNRLASDDTYNWQMQSTINHIRHTMTNRSNGSNIRHTLTTHTPENRCFESQMRNTHDRSVSYDVIHLQIRSSMLPGISPTHHPFSSLRCTIVSVHLVGRSWSMGAGVLPLVLGVLSNQDWYESEWQK